MSTGLGSPRFLGWSHSHRRPPFSPRELRPPAFWAVRHAPLSHLLSAGTGVSGLSPSLFSFSQRLSGAQGHHSPGHRVPLWVVSWPLCTWKSVPIDVLHCQILRQKELLRLQNPSSPGRKSHVQCFWEGLRVISVEIPLVTFHRFDCISYLDGFPFLLKSIPASGRIPDLPLNTV